jgi:RimJ/RimL family protein N-acetyltransferase
MKLLPLDRPEHFDLVAGWLAHKENHQWLDFGNGRQHFTPTLLKVMAQQPTHFMRLYTSDRDDTAVGIVGLTRVDRVFRTAMFWGVCGEKSFRNRGISNFASSKLMTIAFRDLGLHSVNTWAVAHNQSIRVIERLGFRLIGRQRQCHEIDGHLHDRLLFDLLASEHRELDEARWRRSERSHRHALCAEEAASPG